LDCGEKPNKNNELRKIKTDRAKLCVVKLTNKWDQIGPRKIIAQESHKTESIDILAKRKSMLRVAQQDASHPHTRSKKVRLFVTFWRSTPTPHLGSLFKIGSIYLPSYTVLHGRPAIFYINAYLILFYN
jgi:hypothetical protein